MTGTRQLGGKLRILVELLRLQALLSSSTCGPLTLQTPSRPLSSAVCAISASHLRRATALLVDGTSCKLPLWRSIGRASSSPVRITSAQAMSSSARTSLSSVLATSSTVTCETKITFCCTSLESHASPSASGCLKDAGRSAPTLCFGNLHRNAGIDRVKLCRAATDAHFSALDV
ncbi:hypothetical protein FB451DRAFT_1257557, partial [Mycena latifolia]